MQQNLFVCLLFTGVLPLVLSVSRYYHLIQDGKTWNDAREYCRSTYIDLATIGTDDDMTKLQEEAQANEFTSGAWIGLYTNINKWYWSYNNEPLGSFAPWKIVDTDNINGYEQCGCIWGDDWSDLPCHWGNAYVCFDDTKTGSERYILVPDYTSWYDAQSYCRQHYTDLVSVKDATENSVVGALKPTYWTWIGLRRETWKWSDQTTDMWESISNDNQWQNGDPDDYIMNKSCVFLSNGVADLAQCSDTMPFFCYSLPDHQQIISMKVSSKKDVNDPAVKAAILEKIKQKLKDHGLSWNITVKWRQQLDGLVFHKEENNTHTMKNTYESCDLK